MLLILHIFNLLHLCSAETESEVRKRLSGKLLKGYDKFHVPAGDTNEPVNVSLTMWPYDILYIKESQSSIKFSGWIDMRWKDRQLVWDPDKYSNISHLFIPSRIIWTPSIDIFYSKEESASMKSCDNCYAKVDHDGQFLYGQYFAFSFPCRINVKYFPFDEQSCELELANWFLDDRQMDLYASNDKHLDLSVFLPNEEWDLLNITVSRKVSFFNYGYFPSLSYRLYVRRKPFYYIQNLVLPTFAITVTAVVGFHSPTTGLGFHQEKVKIGLTTILSILILQLGISDKMPKTTNAVPLLNIYYSSMVLILSMAIVSSSLVILIEKQGIYGKPVPKWINRVLQRHKSIRLRFQEARRSFHNWNSLGGTNCAYDNFTSAVSAAEQQTAASLESLIWKPRDRVPPPTPKRNGAEPPLSVEFKFLGRSLEAIRLSVAKIEARQKEEKRLKKISRDWSDLADTFERISLAIFLMTSIMSLLMFFFHGWY